ncbi:MAG: ABC transporter permease, partial [Bacteriovoracaceae bacterium]|nr:ABC transporter permease [Bacteriovoracaceae bacterium]
MLTKKLKETFKIIFKNDETIKISLAVVLGLGFSVAVILSTIGIMDGFVSTLKTGLQRTNGDMTLTFRRGFFEYDQTMQDRFLSAGITEIAEVVQTESFLIKQSENESDREAKGVLARGVDTKIFGRVVGMDLKVQEHEIVIGSQLAQLLKLKVGDEVVLTMAKGNSE